TGWPVAAARTPDTTAVTTTATTTRTAKRRSPASSTARVIAGASRARGDLVGGEAQVGHRPRLERVVARRPAPRVLGLELWLGDVADALLEARATGMEPASAGRVDGARDVTLEH